MTRVVAVAAVVLALAGPAPAWAHEEINPAIVPTGKPAFLTLSAANEERSDITRVTLTAPDGVAFGEATRQPSGWTVDKAGSRIAWSGGRVAPEAFEQWGFELEGPGQPGTFRYRVSLGLADGTAHDSEVVVTVVAGTAAAVPTTGPAGPATSSPPATTGATTAAAGNAGSEKDDDSSGPALFVAIAALGLAVIALGRGTILRRRSIGGGPDAGTKADGGPADPGQDW